MHELQCVQGETRRVRTQTKNRVDETLGGEDFDLRGRAPPKGGPIPCRRCGDPFQRKCGNQHYCERCRGPARAEYKRMHDRIYYVWNAEKVKANSRRSELRDPERYRRLKREYMARKTKLISTQVIGHYSDWKFACMCCGESERDFLSIDHVAGNGNKMSRELGIPREGYQLYRWLFNNGLPSGFQVVCMNCNLSKGKHGSCVHERNLR